VFLVKRGIRGHFLIFSLGTGPHWGSPHKVYVSTSVLHFTSVVN